MDAREILLSGFTRLSRELGDALAGLDEEQLNRAPGGNSVTIGFNAWHVFRTIDNIVNFVLQRKQPVWLTDGYMEKLQLAKHAQGTDMSMEEARQLRINDSDVLREYGEKALASCRAYIENASEADFDGLVKVNPFGEIPRWKAISEVITTHCSQHLGEINMARGLMGMRGAAEPFAG